MTTRRDETFYCPHGVDVTPGLRTEPENATTDFVTGNIKYTYEQNECLRCTADMGNVFLFMGMPDTMGTA